MATPARDPACYSALEGEQAGSPAFGQLHHSKDTILVGRLGRVRKKTSCLKAQFQRLRAGAAPRSNLRGRRLDADRDLPHAQTGTAYVDPGPDHGRKAAPTIRAEALVRQIERLGFICEIKPSSQFRLSRPAPRGTDHPDHVRGVERVGR